MPPPQRRRPRTITRDDLPTEFTPASVRAMDRQAIRQLARHGNGILSDAEQHASIGIGDGDRAAMAALHQASTRHLDQNGIVLHHFPLIGTAQEEDLSSRKPASSRCPRCPTTS